MHIRVLGPLAVTEDGRELAVGPGRQRALLALLVTHGDHVASTDQLIDELWSGRPPSSAAKVLQGYISQLRRVLPPETIVTHASGYRLHAQTDAEEFDELLEAARGRSASDRAEMLRTALALWHGRAYADVEYEPWAQAEIGRLEELRLVALEERIEADLELGETSRLVPELERIALEQPLRERVAELLMLALYRSGRQADALAVYANTRRRLVDELGIEPGPGLQDLHRRVLAQDRELAPRRSIRPVVAAGRRARWIVLAGVVLVAAGAAAAGWELTHGSSTSEGPGSAVLAIDSHGRRAGVVPLTQTPTTLAFGAGGLWALTNDAIVLIDPATSKVKKTFPATGTLEGIAVARGALWVLSGRAVGNGTLVGNAVPGTVTRLDPRSAVATAAIPLRTGSRPTIYSPGTATSAIASGRDAVWVVDASGAVDRIDVSSRSPAVVATVTGAKAQAIAASGNEVWIDDGVRTVARIDPTTNRITTRVQLQANGLAGIAVGGGAVWVADPGGGQIWRIVPGSPVTAGTVRAGIGVTSVAFGRGVLWAANPFLGSISRIDPASGAVRAVTVSGTPQALAAAGATVWASVTPIASGPEENGVRALPAPTCSPVVSGGERVDFLIASDLPLRGSRSATVPMTRAIEYVLQRHGFRAGRYRVGYQSCDDSTAQAGNFDFAACGANGRTYADDPDLIGLIGPFNSGCAIAELPSTSNTPSGPLAMVSTQTTLADLTRRSAGYTHGLLPLLYPAGRRNFVRIIAPDDAQGASDARLAKELGLHAVYVLDDGEQYGHVLLGGFLHAARKLGLHVAGASSWSEAAAGHAALAERVRRSGADGVFLAGFITPGAAHLLHRLRAALGGKATMIAGDGFLTVPTTLKLAGKDAVGMYVSFAGRPNALLPPAGRRFVESFSATQSAARQTSYAAAYAAQAAELLLAAIARSNGTRASVTKELFAARVTGSILGSFAFTATGDMTPTPVTIFRIVGGNRPNSTYEQDFTGSAIDRVVSVPADLVG